MMKKQNLQPDTAAMELPTRIRIIDEICRAGSGASKKSLHDATGFAWGTVCRIVDNLIEEGILSSRSSRTDRPGRQTSLLELNPHNRIVAGLALGGESWRLVLCNYSFQILHETRIPTPPWRGAAAFRDAIIELIDSALAAAGESRARLHCVGIAVAGIVRPETGELLTAGNLGMPHSPPIPVQDETARILGVPVLLLPAHAATVWGEYILGAHAATPNIVVVGIGIGIGAGIIANGRRIVSRPDRPAGHIGHLYIPGNHRPCACGGIGCLEACAGGRALLGCARELYPEESWQSAREIDLAAAAGNRHAARLLDRAARYEAFATGLLVQMYRPDALIFTGGQCVEGNYLYTRLRRCLLQYLPPGLRDTLNVSISALGEYGGAVGAARLAFEQYF